MIYGIIKSRMKKHNHGEGGFTIVELAIGMLVFAVVALSFLGLFTALVSSSLVAKEKAVASTLATNQMEYLKSLPYDSLAIAGSSISSPSPLPGSITKKVNGITYTIKTVIDYVDDAYDGCFNYPDAATKALYCHNQPAPTGAAADSNPKDYKAIRVTVLGPSNTQLAFVDTQVAARVAETASTTGALFIKVVDASGNPISGATVQVVNSTVSPAVNFTDSTDSNGIAVEYGLSPDNGYDYKITASKSGYSTLTTLAPPNGTLQPTYPSQKILTQQSSSVTLTIKPQGTNSLIVETTDTSGTALPNAKVYAKGGYKKYTATTDTSYYFDNMSPSDTRPMTDSGGLAAVTNLVPGSYIFCGDKGDTGCVVGSTTYYLAAAVPYGGSNPFNPVIVPTYDPSNPPATTFGYGGVSYLQKVRLMLTTNANFPRINTVTPSHASLGSDPISNFGFTISGTNLPCTASGSGCGTTVAIKQGTNTYTASCTGTGAGTQLSCYVNLTGITAGGTTLSISSGGNTLNVPGSPLIGGLIVIP